MAIQIPLAVYASIIACFVTTAGILVVRHFENWGRRNSTYFACFAAGVLISVSFLHLVPESLELTTDAPVFLLSGYLGIYMLNRLFASKVCDRLGNPSFAIGLIPMIGIGFHSFIDGAVYSIAFTVSTYTGALTAIGMVLHEFPEGIVTYVLLLKGKFAARTAFWLAFLSAALTTPLGALSAYPLVGDQDPVALGKLLALSAGALFYVGASHLLPMVEREPRRFSFLVLAAGVGTAVGIVLSKG